MSTTMSVPSAPGSQRAYWACQLAGWGVYGAAQTYAAAVYVDIPWLRVIPEVLLLCGSALVLTHLLRTFMRRRQWERLRMLALAPRLAAVSFVPGVPLGLLNNVLAISALREPGPALDDLAVPPEAVLPLHMLNWSLIILCWCVLYFVILTARQRRLAELRQSELARALQLAELRVLKSQLNPHFLFNSLNTVRALIADDPTRAQQAVTHLAKTLRYTLNSGQEELVTLAQELEIVGDYLALESLRYGGRLAIERDVAEATLGVRIPVMLLQTVVENAIKHGIAELPAGGTLRMHARLEADGLVIDVENPRPEVSASASVPREAPTQTPRLPEARAEAARLPDTRAEALRLPEARAEGLGLINAAERLRLLFGADSSLELDLTQAGRALARIRIPNRPITDPPPAIASAERP